MTSSITPSEMVESLTGFDELAIQKHMGVDPYSDAERKPMAVIRALIFIQHRRDGLKDAEAKEAAMSMPMREVEDFFADEEDEIDPENPETPSGEGSAPSA